jgi:hypothetical protein
MAVNLEFLDTPPLDLGHSYDLHGPAPSNHGGIRKKSARSDDLRKIVNMGDMVHLRQFRRRAHVDFL